MKTKLFFLFAAGFMLFIISCKNDLNNETIQDEISSYENSSDEQTNDDEFSDEDTNGTESTDIEFTDEDLTGELNAKIKTNAFEIVFSGSDIQSFNTTTGEITFTHSDEIFKKIAHQTISLYINDKLLFENIDVEYLLSSRLVNDLVFVFDLDYILAIENDPDSDFSPFSKLFLTDGYPPIQEKWTNDFKDELRNERNKNAQNRKTKWEFFIKYLTNAGKIAK